jgi:hypothetical protein
MNTKDFRQTVAELYMHDIHVRGCFPKRSSTVCQLGRCLARNFILRRVVNPADTRRIEVECLMLRPDAGLML